MQPDLHMKVPREMEESQESQVLRRNLVREYEDLVRSMRNQLNVYEEEHVKLKKELSDLMSENEELSRKLNFEFKQRIKDESLPKIIESEMVKNLRDQLEMCKREKEKTFELYQASAKLIERLEGEIRDREKGEITSTGLRGDGRSPSLSALESKLRSARERLEMEVANREQLERENLKCQTEMANIKMNLEASRSAVEELKEKDREWKERYTRMEQDYTLLNATLECVSKTRNELENKVDAYGRKIQDLTCSCNEARYKVGEALDLVERAVAERNASILREGELQKEVNKLQLCLKHVIDEAGKKVSGEVEEIKKKYDAHIHKALKEVPEMKSELEKKTLELKRMTHKFKRLEKACTAKLDKEKISLIKGSETEIAMLESQLDGAYKELERVKLKNEELAGEKEKAEDDLSKLQSSYQALARSKEREEKKAGDEIGALREQLQKKVEELAEFSKRTEFFLTQIRDLQTENKNAARLVESGNSERAKLRKALDARTAQVEDLEEHVESLKAMNEKWKSEMRGMTEEFEARVKEMKRECCVLKKKNSDAVKELDAARRALAVVDRVG